MREGGHAMSVGYRGDIQHVMGNRMQETGSTLCDTKTNVLYSELLQKFY